MKNYSLKCRDRACPSRNVCSRFTHSTKLGVKNFGRVEGDAKCSGFIELLPEKFLKKCLATDDVMP